MTHLFCFGLGYSALRVAERAAALGWKVSGTTRTPGKQQEYQRAGYDMRLFDGTAPVALPEDVTHMLHSIPPDEAGDAVAEQMGGAIAALPRLRWFGYLSTTGVYGDAGGGWVDETTPVNPANERQRRRVEAEKQWLERLRVTHVFRLAGIYGPGRNAVADLREGATRRIVKKGQFFSRIHVDDIAAAVLASMQRPTPGEVFNLCDDLPAPSHEVVAYAAELLGVAPPPAEPYGTAALSPMARSFYQSNRRVKNDKIKHILGITLAYPTYREGLKALAST